MITEIITFAIPDGMTRDEIVANYRDAVWLEQVRSTYGSEPTVQYFETPLVADNALGKTIIDEGPAEV